MPEPKPWVRPKDVTEAVARWTGVSYTDLLGPKRSKRFTHARALLYTCMRALDFSLKDIGRWTNRDHTTVIHGLQQYEFDMDEIACVIDIVRVRTFTR